MSSLSHLVAILVLSACLHGAVSASERIELPEPTRYERVIASPPVSAPRPRTITARFPKDLPEPVRFDDSEASELYSNVDDVPTELIHWGYRPIRFGFGFRPRYGYGFANRYGIYSAPFAYSSYYRYRPYLSYYRTGSWGIGYRSPIYRPYNVYRPWSSNAIGYSGYRYLPVYNRSYYFSPSFYSPVSVYRPRTWYYGAGSYGGLYYGGCY